MIQPAGVASRYRVWRSVGLQDGKGRAQGLLDCSGVPIGDETLGEEMAVGDFVLFINGIS
jgi:hypothetical protein